ncbi:MAG TPA: TetR/AcrR family transcriptional regulator [Nevskiales bacterium]|nr:TetR/AcrR family transcriptional regulator [Nevskiales bacterium]
MPRNKIQQDSAEKRSEIVGAARTLFLETGYEATSMASIAAAAGVAPNTIYWYFRDKDELLVAVLDAELESGMAEFLRAPATDTTSRLLMVVRQLERARRLVATVHARIQISPVIAAWHDRFHELSEMLIQSEMHQAGIPRKKAKALVKIWVFTVEGLLAHPMSDAEKRRICSSLAKNLITA